MGYGHLLSAPHAPLCGCSLWPWLWSACIAPTSAGKRPLWQPPGLLLPLSAQVQRPECHFKRRSSRVGRARRFLLHGRVCHNHSKMLGWGPGCPSWMGLGGRAGGPLWSLGSKWRQVPDCLDAWFQPWASGIWYPTWDSSDWALLSLPCTDWNTPPTPVFLRTFLLN